MIGKTIAHYRITTKLGEGGMGEVYRARDTKLGRDVALKVLPEIFARDTDRMARFEREAQVLASLNHPHIAAIYGLEESNGIRALVMEVVEGPTLAERIDGRAMALEEALPIAKQIAEALEYAHEKGIIHRDLKPANVKLTADGNVKVLDFGLAKALEEQAPVGNPSVSPTLTLEGTRAGVILGTAAYMSPEQARGAAADKRADIWAFGCVLYEMLTGKAVFHGETTSDILAAVLKSEPDWSALPNTTPLAIRNLIGRCLLKDRKQRLQAIGEARITLESPTAQESAPVTAPSQSRLRMGASIIVGVLLIALGILSFMHFREVPPQRTVLRYTIPAPENTTNPRSFAISPNGRLVAIAAQASGKRQLWLRALDGLQAQPMAGTDEAIFPFWSPDSRYIGFLAQGKLKKIAASGGPAQSLCDAPNGVGGSWNHEDVILFSSNASGAGLAIQRVSAAGGVPADVTKNKGISLFPVFLPDGRHFLYVVTRASVEQNGVYLSSLDGKENRRVLPDVTSVVFAAGHLLFIRENTLMAQLFDAASGQAKGDVVPVAEGVSFLFPQSAPSFTVSETGVLLYRSGAASGNNQMAWYDRSGKFLGRVGSPSLAYEPAISPDEKSVVFRREAAGGVGVADLWLRDLARGAEQRFTTNASANWAPFWSPQGDRIAFASTRNGGIYNLYQKAASGTGQDELLFANDNSKRLSQWSRDGRFIVYSELDPKTNYDIWVLPIDRGAERKPVPFLRSEFNELHGQLSPDSRWMAYTSDESGQREVYVRPFPASERQWRISITGGDQPRWRGDGKELFFVGADAKMMAVAVKTVAGPKPSFEPGSPQPLLEAHLVGFGFTVVFEYDVTADGKRFLLDTVGAIDGGSASPPLLNVVVNWDAGLKK